MVDIPPYIYCDECPERHFLTLNRDLFGKWSIGYVDFVTNGGIHTGNNFESIDEALEFIKKDLDDPS